jgi:hypothetical protein
MSLRLDWCSHEAAKYAVEHWHYSASMPAPPLVRIGVWESEQYIGCVLFSRGAARHIGRPFDLEQTEIVELTRVALRQHSAPVSKVLAIAVKMLRKQSPGLRLIVSYADPKEGHVGGIYQASGWAYLGEQTPTTEYIGPDGKRWHSRMISPTGRKKVYGEYRAVWRPDQCEAIRCPAKHKYVLPLDDAMRKQIAPLSKPYPKRAGSILADASPVQGEEGGAAPTPALHSGATSGA